MEKIQSIRHYNTVHRKKVSGIVCSNNHTSLTLAAEGQVLAFFELSEMVSNSFEEYRGHILALTFAVSLPFWRLNGFAVATNFCLCSEIFFKSAASLFRRFLKVCWSGRA